MELVVRASSTVSLSGLTAVYIDLKSDNDKRCYLCDHWRSFFGLGSVAAFTLTVARLTTPVRQTGFLRHGCQNPIEPGEAGQALQLQQAAQLLLAWLLLACDTR